MNQFEATFGWVVSMFAIGCGGSAPKAEAPVASASGPAIAGKWRSDCTPMGNGQAFLLDFDIGEKDWALDYVVHADDKCATKFLTVRIEGPYEIGGASTVPSAHEARFGFSKKSVVPHLDAAASFLESEKGCAVPGFSVGQPKDISATGCANLGQRPIAQCAADYDLVHVEGSELHFGDRPKDNDMCSEDKRPKGLAGLAVKRI
jgi:hypothetical protein